MILYIEHWDAIGHYIATLKGKEHVLMHYMHKRFIMHSKLGQHGAYFCAV